jgi:hypothetical protein
MNILAAEIDIYLNLSMKWKFFKSTPTELSLIFHSHNDHDLNLKNSKQIKCHTLLIHHADILFLFIQILKLNILLTSSFPGSCFLFVTVEF